MFRNIGAESACFLLALAFTSRRMRLCGRMRESERTRAGEREREKESERQTGKQTQTDSDLELERPRPRRHPREKGCPALPLSLRFPAKQLTKISTQKGSSKAEHHASAAVNGARLDRRTVPARSCAGARRAHDAHAVLQHPAGLRSFQRFPVCLWSALDRTLDALPPQIV